VKKVFITRKIPEIAKKILSRKFEVHSNKKNQPYPREKLLKIVQKYDAVLSTVTEKFDKSILKNKDSLCVISNYASGLDNIDINYAQSVGISVYNTPDAVIDSTADLTFSILLSLIRKIIPAQEFISGNKWKSWNPEILLGEELSGKSFGILGFGRIGQAVGKRALGFGLKVFYYNRLEKKLNNKLSINATAISLDELLENSDYISVHLPLNDHTFKMINLDFFKKMKKTPVFLNMSRGEIVNTNDLVKALNSNLIRGAALDVVDPEPLPLNHSLYGFNNLILVPHIGTATVECRERMAKVAAENIVNHFY